MSTNQGWSQFPPPPPPPPSGGGGGSTVLVVLLIVGGALVLCCGGAGALVFVGFRQASNDIARQLEADLQDAETALAGFQQLDGEWHNISTHSTYTIRTPGAEPRLMSIVDDDGQVFVIEQSSWDGTNLHWKYRVPSTGYVVEETVHLRDADNLDGNWVSTAPDGLVNQSADTWTRIAPPTDPAALVAAFDAEWLCASSQAIYTIRSESGEPRLMSIVDDDSEVFVIQASSWDGTSISWTYNVPSTGQTVSETVRMINNNHLSGEYTSTAPNGESTTGADSWFRQ